MRRTPISAVLLLVLIAINTSCTRNQYELTDYEYLKSVLPLGYISDESEIWDISDVENDSEYSIVMIFTVTGIGFRGTTRLVIFHKTKGFMGVYSGIPDKPVSISNVGIKFPYEDRFGNIIIFEEQGPQSTAWLDGEFFVLE